jgi:GNAT superfamily N-acetyltransferase
VAGEADSGLREQLVERIAQLDSGRTVDLAEHIGEFPEVEEAFSIPHTTLGLAPEGQCMASAADGGNLELIGFLYRERDGRVEPVMEFKRTLKLAEACADHEWLKVEPRFRGLGLSSALLLRSFALYKSLGLREVELQAQMETGKWHWARVGFEFEAGTDRERVRDWAAEVCEALRINGLKIDSLSTATQFARMSARRGISMREMAEAFPQRGEQIEAVARSNYLKMDDPIALGRAVMLTGPGWNGRLDLHGPGYAQFKAYADSKAEQADGALAQP